MPAIQVARTDTFEQQRVKINEIGSAIFNVTAGGSDLSTGNLKLGDGSITSPSLAFDNDSTLGLYKPSNFQLGFVSNSKKVLDLTSRRVISYKDLFLSRTSVKADSISTVNSGSGYEGTETYTGVELTGGTGLGATADITVAKFSGTFTNGSGYTNGTFTDAILLGSGVDGVRATIGIVDGSVANLDITNHGSGTATIGLVLTVRGVTSKTGGTATAGDTIVSFSDVSNINAGDSIIQQGGTGVVDAAAVVTNVNGVTNEVTLDIPATTSGTVDIDFVPPYGDATTDSTFTIDTLGAVSNVSITSGGAGYIVNDELSVDPEDLVATISYLVTAESVTEFTLSTTEPASNFTVGSDADFGTGGFGGEGNVYEIVGVAEDESGNAVRVIVDGDATADDGGQFRVDGAGTFYTVSAAENVNRFFLQTGTGAAVYAPDLTFYVGSTYSFQYPEAHPFAFSEFPDGPNPPSFIEDRRGTLDINSFDVTLTSVTGIVVGMEATISEASGFGTITSEGALLENTLVTAIDTGTNTITLSKPPLTSGLSALDFKGVEYVNRVTRSGNMLMITIASDTPSLYYYCKQHENMAGVDGTEAIITMDPNNPVTFGSGFLIRLADIETTEVIQNSITDGKLTATSIESLSSLVSDTLSGTTSLTTPLINGETVNLSAINALESDSITITSGNTSISGDFSIGSFLTVTSSSGNVQSGGQIRASSFNSNNTLIIDSNEISTQAGYELTLRPADQEVAKVDATTSLVIPSGTTEQRPIGDRLENGAIRFNETTKQYEGYSEDSSSWSSLGGVRDVDGNTFIIAEETVGANDNNIWFYNDDINTLKLGDQFLSFQSIKSVRSQNTSAQSYTDWISNQPVTDGQYLKSGYNIYEVITSGTTGTSGNAPNNTSGDVFLNGDAELQWVNTAVDDLTLTEINDLKITTGTKVTFSDDLRITDNTISTLENDIVVAPFDGQKTVINSTTSLVIPVGDNSNKGSAAQGSIRYNTADQTFEGYDGANWGSLGGVKDVDQNTYIIPETEPGEDENILYFYNEGANTLRLTTTSLEFDAIDTVKSLGTDEFELTASLLTVDSAALTIDNTLADTTYIHSSKQYFDFGISSGLVVDPVLRLDNVGDLFFNTTFGTGSPSFVKLISADLKTFELEDVKTSSTVIQLLKGTTDSGVANLYLTSLSSGCKTTVIAHNITNGEKEFIEFGVLDSGSDVFFTEYGNIISDLPILDTSFTITSNNEVRLAVSLTDTVDNNHNVRVTVVTTATKK